MTLLIMYNTAQEIAMQASVEAMHEIQKIITASAPVENNDKID